VVFVIWLATGAIAAWQLTRRPRPAFAEPPPTVAGETMRQHRLRTSDGEEVGAWYRPARPQRGTIVFLHGIGGSRSAFRTLFEPLAAEGYGVLAVSLRSHGDSTGGAHDVGYSARHDVMAAVEFLEGQAPGARVIVCGTSFGAAAAAYASGELGGRVHGYLFDSLYADVRSTIWNRLDRYLPPGLDYAAYVTLRLWAPAFLPVGLDVLRPRDHLSGIPTSTRVVFAVGTNDFRSPPADAREMYEMIRGHAEFVEFSGAEHSLLHVHDRELYLKTLTGLLQERLP
jgi:pimeloyl-ACP methyl ester carboxylesterase